MAWPSRGRRESIIRDESFIFIGRTRGRRRRAFDSLGTSRALCPSQRLERSINLFSYRDFLFTLSHPVRRIEIFGCGERERIYRRLTAMCDTGKNNCSNATLRFVLEFFQRSWVILV